jgi:hypothetical protein
MQPHWSYLLHNPAAAPVPLTLFAVLKKFCCCSCAIGSVCCSQISLLLLLLWLLPQLSKLLCASVGQVDFSMECWDRAVQLERQRRARVAAMQGPAAQAPAAAAAAAPSL